MKVQQGTRVKTGLVGTTDFVFSFSNFSGYFAEYDADVGITLGTGSSVSGWADQSSNSYDLSEATSTLQPTLITSDSNFNGHNSVSGDSTERITANIGTEVDGDDPDLTVYMVLRWNVSTSHAFKRAAGFWRSTSTNPYWSYGTGFGQQTNVDKRDDTGAGGDASQASNLIDTNPHVYAWKHTGTSLDMWEDGVQVATSTFFDRGTATFDRLQLFQVRNISGANIRFARVIFYNAAHSDVDRQAIQDELGTIYGITIT